MSSIDKSGVFKLGSRIVKRLGYGAMQLAGPGARPRIMMPRWRSCARPLPAA